MCQTKKRAYAGKTNKLNVFRHAENANVDPFGVVACTTRPILKQKLLALAKNAKISKMSPDIKNGGV
jgi:hypothetical protein